MSRDCYLIRLKAVFAPKTFPALIGKEERAITPKRIDAMIFVIASKLIGLRLWCKSRGGGVTLDSMTSASPQRVRRETSTACQGWYFDREGRRPLRMLVPAIQAQPTRPRRNDGKARSIACAHTTVMRWVK